MPVFTPHWMKPLLRAASDIAPPSTVATRRSTSAKTAADRVVFIIIAVLPSLCVACFVTDFGTVLALGAFFADFNKWMLVFVAVLAVTLWYLPRWTRAVVSSFGQSRVSEPEVKFLFLVLFFLGGVATTAKSEAVLPAYLAGLVVAGVFLQDKVLVHRMLGYVAACGCAGAAVDANKTVVIFLT